MFKKFAVVTAKVVNGSTFGNRTYAKKIVEYDPEYVYVVVRALTADKPNSNGDCFPHEELIRVDQILNRPVYASFIGKGVYINHQHTDDPRYAKGVVLDARYVQNENDKYVELLLGIDKKKDPVFARDVERGLINKFSMGASVQFTRCSVCGNEARKTEDFCEHIAKYKMRPVKTPHGEKLAYELCYGVTYNEISAVADPADETAQLLAKVAHKSIKEGTKNTKNADISHGTVVLLNDIKNRLIKLEASMKKSATPEKGTNLSPDVSEKPDLGTEDVPALDSVEFDLDLPEEGEAEATAAVDVLKIVEDLLSKRVSPEEAVSALEEVVGGSEEEPVGEGEEEETEELPGEGEDEEEEGEEVEEKEDKEVGVNEKWELKSSSKKDKKDKKLKKAEKDEGCQYPYEDVEEKKIKQFPNPSHDSRHKPRPEKDFDEDVKEYSELTNVSAEFVPNRDRRLAGWKVCDGDRPLFMVTGANAWGEYLDEMWDRFASRAYGEALVRAILENGLEPTMRRVNAVAIQGGETKEAVTLDERLLRAAEQKARDMAEEMAGEFRVRFIEGIRLALKLQDKNVLDNPIRGAAWELLTKSGLDGKLAEKIAPASVVEAHFDEALRKALEYTEMSPEAFEEVLAQVESMAPRMVTSSVDTNDASAVEELESASREYLARRVAKNIGGINMMTPGETPQRSFSEALSQAVRAAKNSIIAPPSKPLDEAFGKKKN